MAATVPTEALTRYLAATPQQQEVIDRFLRRGAPASGAGPRGGARDEVREALRRIEQKVDAVKARLEGGAAAPEAPASAGEAERVFVLLQRLEGEPKQRKAPLPLVFRLLVLRGLSQRAAAARCGCAESLISARAAALERAFGLSLERLRAYASALVEMETAVKGDRTRRKRDGQPDDFARGDEAAEGGEAEEDEGGQPDAA